MESTSSMHELSQDQNTGNEQAKIRLRKGQKEVLEHFIHHWDEFDGTVAQLPTGYGKTLTAAACYQAARNAGKANRLLYIVPRRGQAQQAAQCLPDDLEKTLGVTDLKKVSVTGKDGKVRVTKSWTIGNNIPQALMAHRNGECEIFVLTVQSLMFIGGLTAVRDLLGSEKWMVVIDEHHHYGLEENSRWTVQIASLPHSCRLAMSATANRLDGKSYFPDPHIVVPYIRSAQQEGVVKELHLNVYEYIMEVEVPGEGVREFTCDELIRILGADTLEPSEVQAKMAERDWRFLPKYISPLIEFPVARLQDLMIDHGIAGQMLVQALTCDHAKVLCDQIRSLIGNDRSVDWVGTKTKYDGRPDEENKEVLRRFCPDKNEHGKREWKLDILVNVGMAGEGLDTVDVCEVVFCTRPTLNPSTLQAIGRASRIMDVPDGVPQPVGHINIDKVSELRDMVGWEIMKAFDGDSFEGSDDFWDERELRDYSEPKPLPENSSVVISDIKLVNIMQDPVFCNILSVTSKSIRQDRNNYKILLSDEELDDRIARKTEEEYRKLKGADLEKNNGASHIAIAKKEVADTTSSVGRLVWIIKYGQARKNMNILGQIKHKIQKQRLKEVGCGIPEAGLVQLEEHRKWNVRLDRELRSAGIPEWLDRGLPKWIT